MRLLFPMGFVLLTLGIAGGNGLATALAQEPTASPLMRWEYRVVTKEQLLELGSKDLAAGLNKLGDEGWELTAVDGVYVFKRPNRSLTLEDVKQWVFVAQGEVEAWKDRVAWTERMVKKGYLNERRLEDERGQLQAAEFSLDKAQKALKALSAERIPPPKKESEK